jgi:general secretion pathway protein I
LDPVKPGIFDGHFDDRYRWHLEVMPWTAPGVTLAGNGNANTSPMQMYRLDLDVMWGSEPFVHHAHFSTLRIGTNNTLAPGL